MQLRAVPLRLCSSTRFEKGANACKPMTRLALSSPPRDVQEAACAWHLQSACMLELVVHCVFTALCSLVASSTPEECPAKKTHAADAEPRLAHTAAAKQCLGSMPNTCHVLALCIWCASCACSRHQHRWCHAAPAAAGALPDEKHRPMHVSHTHNKHPLTTLPSDSPRPCRR